MDVTTLTVVGSAYGGSVFLSVLRRAWRRRSAAEAYLAGLLACGVVAIVTIVLQHRVDGELVIALLERLEHVATLASGPALWLYVRSLTGGCERAGTGSGPGRRELLHFAPALALVLAPLALVPLAAAPPIEVLLLHQAGYTAAATGLRVRRRSTVRRGHRLPSLAVLVILAAVHAAQAVRIATRGEGILVDVVPVTLSALLLAGGGLALAGWLTGGTGAPPRRRPSGVATGRAAEAVTEAAGDSDLLARLDRLMRQDHVYRRTDLGLHDLARLLEVTPHRLSEALNGTAGVPLHRYLLRFRLDDARRRLLDPDHDVYTIEALGEKSGFGSRSTFYAAFRREVGLTPARFRETHRPTG